MPQVDRVEIIFDFRNSSEECECEKTKHKWSFTSDSSHRSSLVTIDVTLMKRGDGSNEPIHAWDNFTKELNLYHPNSPLRLSVDRRSAPDGFCLIYFYSDPHNIRVGSLYKDLALLADQLHQITLISRDKKEFKIGKFLFMSRSAVFKNMFTNDTREKRDNSVTFEEDSDVLEQFVMFLKTDTVAKMDGSAYRLAKMAHMYGIPLLWSQVECFYLGNCNLENEDHIMEVACLFRSRKLFGVLSKLPAKRVSDPVENNENNSKEKNYSSDVHVLFETNQVR